MTDEELRQIEVALDKEFRVKVRATLFTLTVDCLGSPRVQLLSVLGIDANEKLLQIFTDEAKQLLSVHKEDADARS